MVSDVNSQDLSSKLGKFRQSFFGQIKQALGQTQITDETWDDLEAVLVQADVGVAISEKVINRLKDRVKREGITTPEQ